MFKKKKKIDTSNLISLVISDDIQVSNSLKRIFSNIDGNWKIYTCKNCYSFSDSKLGVREDFTLELKFKDEELKKVATASSKIFIATLPDDKGYYNKYKIYTYLKYLKVSVPIYSMNLPFISEESVLYYLMNTKRIAIDKKKVIRYEARIALDRLVKFNTNEMFKQMLPVQPNLESSSALILNFIDSFSSKTQYVKYNGRVDFFTLRKNEKLSKEYSYTFKKLSKVVNFTDLMFAYARVGKLIGSVKSMVELYSKGVLSYPTNSTSFKSFVTDKDLTKKVSDKSWGVYARSKVDAPISETATSILDSFNLLTSVKTYRQDLKIGNVDLVSFTSKKKEGNLIFSEEKNSIGVSQKELVTYFEHIKLPSKMWAYQLFTLVKNGLVAEVSETSYCLTALGKLVLQIVRNKVPRLLNELSVTKINEGISKLKDEETRFDFITDRWDRINIELTSIEEFEVPKVKSRCSKCGTRLSLNVTDKNVFVRCQNTKCSKDIMLPIEIKNNLIYAKE